METLIKILLDYLNALAWVFGVISTLLVVLQLYMAATYNKLDELVDKTKGFTQTFPVLKPGIVMILCWTWVIIN